ncbi:tetratricopeptide repeat protein [Pseudobutyrivibrio xylanivorans]|uniref:Tetratricopeptide repeat protein n=1 Tax=Pseudobutyrivibrio xylanivorans TaxID=185007 RepID=A0A5P6VPX7_PSEXY|nr:tetratricopeptide repeat protein [Pseudobutyrivibrio xylanivorans]QFJ53739.1 tetratricopeptide repeat protein [Pseudobutyrivibrio xylanivorans]
MKKRLLTLALIIGAAGCLTGCSRYNQKEIQLRDQGVAAMEEGNYEEAVSLFDKALGCSIGKVTDLELDIDYYKAAAQFKNNQFEDAASTYTYLIKYDDKNYKPYFLRGSIYAGEGEIGQAIKDYDAAVAIDEKNYLLYIEIYDNLNALGYTDQGLVYLNNALEVSDKSAESKYFKGRIYYILGQSDEAEKLLKEANEKGVIDAKLYLAKIYQDNSDYVSAQALLEEYAASEEVTSEALGTLGDIELTYGNYENALNYYEAGLSLDSIDNMSQLMKGKVAALEKLNRYSEAKEVLAQYIEKYPNDEEAQKEQIFLQSR